MIPKTRGFLLKSSTFLSLSLSFLFIVQFSGTALAQTTITRSVLSAGGGLSQNGSPIVLVRSTVGQGIAGSATTGVVQVRLGFWTSGTPGTVSVPDPGDGPKPETPRVFFLHPSYPNPATSSINFVLDVPKVSRGSLELFDVKGRKIKTLHKGSLEPGKIHIVWNGSDDNGTSVSAGIYFYKLVTPEYQSVRQLTLLR